MCSREKQHADKTTSWKRSLQFWEESPLAGWGTHSRHDASKTNWKFMGKIDGKSLVINIMLKKKLSFWSSKRVTSLERCPRAIQHRFTWVNPSFPSETQLQMMFHSVVLKIFLDLSVRGFVASIPAHHLHIRIHLVSPTYEWPGLVNIQKAIENGPLIMIVDLFTH